MIDVLNALWLLLVYFTIGFIGFILATVVGCVLAGAVLAFIDIWKDIHRNK